MVFLLHYNKSFALLLSNFTPLELRQCPCVVSTSGQPIGFLIWYSFFCCTLHYVVLSKISTHLSVLYMVSKSILLLMAVFQFFFLLSIFKSSILILMTFITFLWKSFSLMKTWNFFSTLPGLHVNHRPYLSA